MILGVNNNSKNIGTKNIELNTKIFSIWAFSYQKNAENFAF